MVMIVLVRALLNSLRISSPEEVCTVIFEETSSPLAPTRRIGDPLCL
jgi:hypothetical protein